MVIKTCSLKTCFKFQRSFWGHEDAEQMDLNLLACTQVRIHINLFLPKIKRIHINVKDNLIEKCIFFLLILFIYFSTSCISEANEVWALHIEERREENLLKSYGMDTTGLRQNKKLHQLKVIFT